METKITKIKKVLSGETKVSDWAKQFNKPKPLFRGASDFWFLPTKFIKEKVGFDDLTGLGNEIDDVWSGFFDKTDEDFF